MGIDIERYIGGGKAFFSRWNGTGYDAEVEIGEVVSVTLKVTSDTVEAFSKDSGSKKRVEKVPIKIDASFSFSTQNLNKSNLAMNMYGEEDTESFVIGDTLPDGTVATENIDIPFIRGGLSPIVEGRFKVIAVNLSAGSKTPVLVVSHASLSPNGDARDYFGDKHSALSFNGEMIEKDGEYFKEYLMTKA